MLIRFPQTRALRQRAQRRKHGGEQLQTEAHRKYRPQIVGEVTHRTKNTRGQGAGNLSDRGVSRKCALSRGGRVFARQRLLGYTAEPTEDIMGELDRPG
jgi:hypothetical protein